MISYSQRIKLFLENKLAEVHTNSLFSLTLNLKSLKIGLRKLLKNIKIFFSYKINKRQSQYIPFAIYA